MGWKVEYKGKDGKTATSPAFGSDAAAKSYARTVKDGRVITTDTEAPVVMVQRCDAGPVVDAARAKEREQLLSEFRAEVALEAGSQARLLGGVHVRSAGCCTRRGNGGSGSRVLGMRTAQGQPRVHGLLRVRPKGLTKGSINEEVVGGGGGGVSGSRGVHEERLRRRALWVHYGSVVASKGG